MPARKTAKPAYEPDRLYKVTLNRVWRQSPDHPVIYKPLDEHYFKGRFLNGKVPADAIATAQAV